MKYAENKFSAILMLALVASAMWVIVVLADTIYLPVVIRQATLTPTVTPTPTETATPTVTPTPRARQPRRAPPPQRKTAVDIRIDDIINGNTANDLSDEYILIVNDGTEDVIWKNGR